MLPFCLVVLIPFAYSPAAKNRSLIKSPLKIESSLDQANPLVHELFTTFAVSMA